MIKRTDSFLKNQSTTRKEGKMNTEKIWIPDDYVAKRIIGDENILFNFKNNYLIVLNEQAQAVWDALCKNRKESEIIKKLQFTYNGASKKTISQDVKKLLADLQIKGFLKQDAKQRAAESISKAYLSAATEHFSFSERMHNIALERNIPISGCLELTQRCHLKCIHCYIDDRPADLKNELSTFEIHSLLEQMAEQGCLWLLITGGEPLLRQDFPEIYIKAKKLGMIITIFTSATNINSRIADLFSDYPPFLVEATLHGASETTFDSLTRVKGSFQRFRTGIGLLSDRGVPFHLKMIAMKQNFREIGETSALANELGADDFRFDSMVNADFHSSLKADNLRIAVGDSVELDNTEPFRSRWELIYQTVEEQKSNYDASADLLFPCRAGKCSFSVSSNGYLLPCILMRNLSFDLKEESFLSAWKKMNQYTSTARMDKNNHCLKCAVKMCSKCPAWGYLEHQDPNAKSAFACALQAEREKIFL